MQRRIALMGQFGPAQLARSPWFLAALLLALASAVVPALLPAGGGAGRVAGSAFDPTSNVLSLRVRDQTPRPVLAGVAEGRRLAPYAVPALAPAVAFLLTAMGLAYPLAGAARHLPPALAPAMHRAAARPRAPPRT